MGVVQASNSESPDDGGWVVLIRRRKKGLRRLPIPRAGHGDLIVLDYCPDDSTKRRWN
ncbi:MAG: hypothetical protein ACLR8P_23275 [Clostridium fessum]